MKWLRWLGLGCQQRGGYRTKAGAPPWFSETIQLALDSAAARQIEEVRIVYQPRFSVCSL
jgi:hypothetical protein